jgi:hypothetical protein
MQSAMKSTDPIRAAQKKTIANTLSYIYKENGIKGLYRGVTPRIGLGESPFPLYQLKENGGCGC